MNVVVWKETAVLGKERHGRLSDRVYQSESGSTALGHHGQRLLGYSGIGRRRVVRQGN